MLFKKPVLYLAIALFIGFAIIGLNYLRNHNPSDDRLPPFQDPTQSNLSKKLPSQSGIPAKDKNANPPEPVIPTNPILVKKLINTSQARNTEPTVKLLLDVNVDDTSRNEAANLLRRSGYSGLTDDLVKVLNNPNEGPRFRSFCVQHLWMNHEKASSKERKIIVEALKKSLVDRHIPVRREALLALVRLKDPIGKITAVKWLKAEDTDNVRDLAIRCVKKLDLREHIPTIRSYLSYKNSTIRIATIVALSEWGDETSRPSFEAAAKSKIYRMQKAGKAAIKRLDKLKQKK